MRSPTYRLADAALEESLEEFVNGRRVGGQSWRRISLDLRDATNGTIDVTSETLRSWFPELVGTAK